MATLSAPNPNFESTDEEPSISDDVPTGHSMRYSTRSMDTPKSAALERPSIVDFDSEEFSIVPTVEMQIIAEMEKDNEQISALKEEEERVLKSVKDSLTGSWTQRFTANRMKTKYLNLMFKERLDVLAEFAQKDEADTMLLLQGYNGAIEFTQLHEAMLSLIAQVFSEWNTLERVVEGNMAGILEDALFGCNGVRYRRLIGVMALMLELDESTSWLVEDQYPDHREMEDLQKSIIEFGDKLEWATGRAFTDLEATQNKTDMELSAVRESLGVSMNACPLIKDKVYNFNTVLPFFEYRFKKLLIPKLYLNRMMVEHVPTFKKMSDSVATATKQMWRQWLRYLIRAKGKQFGQSQWEKVKTQYPDRTDPEEGTDAEQQWIQQHLEREDQRLEGEWQSMERLLFSMTMADTVTEVTINGEKVKAETFLCDAGSAPQLLLYRKDDDESLIHAIDLNAAKEICGVEADPSEMILSIALSQQSGWMAKAPKVIIKFGGMEEFAQWMHFHLAPFLCHEE